MEPKVLLPSSEQFPHRVKREMEQENPHYEELCRRFLADAKDFSEENIRKSGITRRFANNGEFDDCVDEIRQALKELVYE